MDKKLAIVISMVFALFVGEASVVAADQLQTAQERINELEEDIKELKETEKWYQQESRSKDQSYADLQNKYTIEVDQLKTEIATKELEQRTLKNDLTTKSLEFMTKKNELEGQKQGLEAEKSDLTTLLHTTVAEKGDLENTLKVIQQELEIAKNSLKKVTDPAYNNQPNLDQTNKEWEKEVRRITKQNDLLKNDNLSFKVNNERLTQERNDFQVLAVDCKKKCEDLKEENADLLEQRSVLESKVLGVGFTCLVLGSAATLLASKVRLPRKAKPKKHKVPSAQEVRAG